MIVVEPLTERGDPNILRCKAIALQACWVLLGKGWAGL